jgi:hypothetical protein
MHLNLFRLNTLALNFIVNLQFFDTHGRVSYALSFRPFPNRPGVHFSFIPHTAINRMTTIYSKENA